mgnify:CR=1 FL=1
MSFNYCKKPSLHTYSDAKAYYQLLSPETKQKINLSLAQLAPKETEVEAPNVTEAANAACAEIELIKQQLDSLAIKRFLPETDQSECQRLQVVCQDLYAKKLELESQATALVRPSVDDHREEKNRQQAFLLLVRECADDIENLRIQRAQENVRNRQAKDTSVWWGEYVNLDLNDHLKTGQRRSSQNRPMGGLGLFTN